MPIRWIGYSSFLMAIWIHILACTPAPTAESCRASQDCKDKGLCVLKEEACVAEKAEDCQASRYCRELGLCSLVQGRCIASTEDDCKKSLQCQHSFRCIPNSGECIEITAGYCRITNKACKQSGLCSLDRKNHACVAKSEKDCVASTDCVALGKCSIDTRSQRCIVKDDKDCQRHACQATGKCRAQGASTSKTCVPSSSQECFFSDACNHLKQKDTNCAFNPITKECVPPSTFCNSDQNETCLKDGKCSWSEKKHRCEAANDKDCAGSQACKNDSKCQAYQGECVVKPSSSCQHSPFCPLKGACQSNQKNQCVPKSDYDCLRSYECWASGRCQVKGEHCRFSNCSIPCEQFGLCKQGQDEFKALACFADSDENCQKSLACRWWGLCKFDSEKKKCVFSGDCSAPCKLSGRCKEDIASPLFPLPEVRICVATSTKDCEQSQQCKDFGTCSFNSSLQVCEATFCPSDVCLRNGNCEVRKWLSRGMCRPTKSDYCQKSQVCSTLGRCTAIRNFNGWTCAVKPLNDTCFGAACDIHCKDTNACKKFGNCHYDSEKKSCLPLSKEDCHKSENCRYLKHCLFEQHTCKERKDITCEKSTACSYHGHCGEVVQDGKNHCVPRNDFDCQNSQLCKEFGLCSSDGNKCIAKDDASCGSSQGCKEHGRCFEENGVCAASNCEQTTVCKEKGLCSLDSFTKNCAASKEEHCKKSRFCELYGWCKLEGTSCIYDEGQTSVCDASCRKFGHCEKGTINHKTACVATTSAHCLSSELCENYGKCRLKDGTCQATSNDCSKDWLCQTFGLCGQQGETCVPLDQSSCEKSVICRLFGRCSFTKDVNYCTFQEGSCSLLPCSEFGNCKKEGDGLEAKCAAGSTNDCFASKSCRLYGHCYKQGNSCAAAKETAPAECPTNCSGLNCKKVSGCTGNNCCYSPDCKGQSACFNTGGCIQSSRNFLNYKKVLGCYPTSNADCRQSDSCKESGFCTYDATLAECIATNDVDCLASTNCKVRGECKASLGTSGVVKNTCYVATQKDCENSTYCKEYGLCNLKDHTCQALVDADCKKSNKKICLEWGRCKVRFVEIKKLRDEKHNDLIQGTTKGKDSQLNLYTSDLFSQSASGSVGVCVAFSNDDCAKTNPCVYDSKNCGLDFVKQICVACKDATDCKLVGTCTFSHLTNKCIVGSKADCERSNLCKAQGKCNYEKKNLACVK